jgi:hypothetical protein
MLPQNLQAESFAGYPPEARKLVVDNLTVLKKLPLSFLPSMLREVIEYDYKFPAERAAIDREVANLASLSPKDFDLWFQALSRIELSTKLEQVDWVNHPAQFVEQESAYLWSSRQLDAFRTAATEYGSRLAGVSAPEPLPVARLGIGVIGQGVSSYDGQLFRKLRSHGTLFTQIKPEEGLSQLLSAVAARAQGHPAPYGHWYVDGGRLAARLPALTSVSYKALEPVRAALLKRMQNEISRPGMGPEELRSSMARMFPGDLGMDSGGDPVLDRFQVKVLTEGSGTQIFSTTFAQWAARECLRRAQPLTLLVRYAPRQRQKPMNEMLSNDSESAEVDPVGSLIDADMGVYYQWISQQRLPGSERSVFLAWFEGHSQAVLVSPSLPRGSQSSSALSLGELVALATG